MTTTAVEAPTRTTASDLTADQRRVLIAIRETPIGRATFSDLAAVLGMTEQRVGHAVHSLPQGIVTGWVKPAHEIGAGLWPEGRTLADSCKRFEQAQLSILMTEGAME